MRTSPRWLVPSLALAALASACDGRNEPTGSPLLDAPTGMDILDGRHGGNPGVAFLPPLVKGGGTDGTFDPGVPLRMEIRHVGGTLVQTFAVGGGGIDVQGNHYALHWSVPGSAVSGDVYRLTVRAYTLELAHVDMEVARSGREASQILAAGENVPVQASRNTLPLKVWVNTEAISFAEAEAEATCATDPTLVACDVAVIPTATGGSVTVTDPAAPDAPTAAILSVEPNDVVDAQGNPVPSFELRLELLPRTQKPSPGIPTLQQLPNILHATATDPDGNPVFFQRGASIVLCQPLDLETDPGAPYHLPTLQATRQVIFKVDGAVTTYLPTTYGAPECDTNGFGSLRDDGAVRGLFRLARRSLGALAGLVLPEPLRATHGGLTSIRSIGDLSFLGAAALTVPSLSDAVVPAGNAGDATTITVQARLDATVVQTLGGDSVVVSVRGANIAGAIVTDNGDGTYSATYTPLNAGPDTVAISILDRRTGALQAVAGSPYVSSVAGSLEVLVSQAGSGPVPGAGVTLSGPASLAAATDAAGRAFFAGLARGLYTVRVAATGFEGQTDAIQVGTPGAVALASVLGACPALPGAEAPTLDTIVAQPSSASDGAVSTSPIQCPTVVEFINETSEVVDVYWIDYGGARVLYQTLQPETRYRQQTWPEHPWIVVGRVSGDLAYFEPLPAASSPAAAIVSGGAPAFYLATAWPDATVASGYGQLVSLLGEGFPPEPRVFAGLPAGPTELFVYRAPSFGDELYARLQVAGSGALLPPGPVDVWVTDADNVGRSQSLTLTVSATPATPILAEVYALAAAPSTGNCGTLGGVATRAAPGDWIAVRARGTDTSGAEVRFAQAESSLVAPSTCSMASPTLGLVSVVQVPTGVNTEEVVDISIRTSVSGVASLWSGSTTLPTTP